MEHKNLNFEIKAEADGTFVAYGSTFGNVDLVGEIVQKGAFTKSLHRKGASGVKMFLQHNSNDIIGKFTDIFEDEKGLVIKGQFFLGNIQKADETHFLMKQGEITQFSIGYRVISKAFDGAGNTLLKEIDLIEVSPVTFPANPEAQLVGIKQMNIKGMSLARALNARIAELIDDDNTRADIVSRMASAAGISESTVNQILNESINIPPEDRLRGFARALNLSLEELMKLTERDDKGNIRELERKLRDVGYSQKEAKAVCAIGYKGLKHRDDVLGNEEQKEADEAEFINLMREN